MRANRRTDTKPELALRHALHQLGYRYRKDYRLDLDGGRRVRPDIAFTARKVAVFVDGCFWHACPEHGSKPRDNEWYWGPKLLRNVERDRANDTALILAGWSVVRLWEHVPLDEAIATVVTALGATSGRTIASNARGTCVDPRFDPSPSPPKLTAQNSGAPCASSCPRPSRPGPGPAGRPGRPRPAARVRGHARAARGVRQRGHRRTGVRRADRGGARVAAAARR